MTLASFYLLTYNIIQFAGWSYILALTVQHLSHHGTYTGLWQEVQLPLKIFQTWMAIEVLHSAIGLVRSGVVTTLMQIVSRVFIVWLILQQVPATTMQPGLLLCVLAWPLAEMSRYLYYVASAVLSVVPSPLTWIRYSLFLVLYPLGVLGEMLCVYYSLPHYSGVYVSLSAVTGSSSPRFLASHILMAVIVLYVPGLLVMYSHMLAQRRKVLRKPQHSAKHKRR